MMGRCDHCDDLAELVDVGSGILYCPACRKAESDMLAGKKPAAAIVSAFLQAEAKIFKAAGKFVNQHGEKLQRRNAYIGERQGPLTAGDKAHICILAREAFVVMHDREPSNQAEFDQWRREQQLKACGFASLTHCDQRHKTDLESHFLNLKGESAKAFKRQMKREVGDKSVALGVLKGNLKKFGLHEGYAATICRSMHKCELANATVKQLWDVVFQIRKNQQRKRRKGLAK